MTDHNPETVERSNPERFRERARALVTTWLEDQIRPEGREGLYVDDEAALMFDITEALTHAADEARREALEEAAHVAFERVRCDDDTDRWSVANSVAVKIRALLRDGGKE